MKIGIIYGTNSGGTREAAHIMSDELEKHKHSVELIDAKDASPETFSKYDALIIGSCTWELKTPKKKFEGTLQEHWLALRDKMKGTRLNGKQIAVFGLGDKSYTSFCIAANHLEALVKQTGATQVGDTLKINEFYFKLEENRKAIQAWAKKIAGAFKPVTG